MKLLEIAFFEYLLVYVERREEGCRLSFGRKAELRLEDGIQIEKKGISWNVNKDSTESQNPREWDNL